QRNQSAAFSSGKVRPNHETNINIIARRTGKDVNSHTVLDGIITTIMATIQRINIIGSREGSRNRRRLKANQRSEERFSRNAETDLVCRLLLEKKKRKRPATAFPPIRHCVRATAPSDARPRSDWSALQSMLQRD